MGIRNHDKRPFYGDCLEGIGFPTSGGIAYVDRDATPEVYDVVFCSGAITGGINGYLKQLIQSGDHPIVRTQYGNGKQNYAFAPEEIYGVVVKATDEDGNVIWERQKMHSPWIPVEERLPENEKPVLAYYGFESSRETRMWYTGVLTYFLFDTVPHWQHESTGLHVTHWMPLPEPPGGAARGG